jgi:2C-methyl-D-erythritol 2,4-cyclodiphosphate synthase
MEVKPTMSINMMVQSLCSLAKAAAFLGTCSFGDLGIRFAKAAAFLGTAMSDRSQIKHVLNTMVQSNFKGSDILSAL